MPLLWRFIGAAFMHLLSIQVLVHAQLIDSFKKKKKNVNQTRAPDRSVLR